MNPGRSPGTLDVRLRLKNSDFLLDVDTHLDLAGITAIFGPSGSGKTTLLRAVAGLEHADEGHISCDGEIWFDSTRGIRIPPHLRPVGLTFQDGRLFSHLDVAGNLSYAEKRRRRRLEDFNRDDVVEALDLQSLLSRKVQSLSGGERQRVALGRTLLSAPRLLQLDEPLSALDRARKAEILPYLENLPRRFHIPTLYVSHDIDEVARLADRVLVLSDGRVQAHGPTAAILERLDLEPYETGVLVEGVIADHDGRLHLSHITLDGGTLTAPMLDHIPTGHSVRMRIRARDVAIATVRPEGLSIRNVLPARIAEITTRPDSAAAEVLVEMGGTHIRARLTRAAVEDLALEAGMDVYALIKSVSFDSLHEH